MLIWTAFVLRRDREAAGDCFAGGGRFLFHLARIFIFIFIFSFVFVDFLIHVDLCVSVCSLFRCVCVCVLQFASPCDVDLYSSTVGSTDTNFILLEGMPERVCSVFTSSRIVVSYPLPSKPPFLGQRCNFVWVTLTCIRAQMILPLKTIFCLKKCMKGFVLCFASSRNDVSYSFSSEHPFLGQRCKHYCYCASIFLFPWLIYYSSTGCIWSFQSNK